MRRKKFMPTVDLMEERTLMDGAVSTLTPSQFRSALMQVSDQAFSMFQRTADGLNTILPWAAMPVVNGSVLHLAQVMLAAPQDANGNFVITPEISAKISGIHAGEYAVWTEAIARSANPEGLANLMGWSYKANPDGSFIVTFPTGVETSVSVDVIASTNGTFQGPTMAVTTYLPDGTQIDVNGDTFNPNPINVVIMVLPAGSAGPMGDLVHVPITIPSPVAEEPEGSFTFTPDMITSSVAPLLIPVIPFDPAVMGLPIIPMSDVDEFPDPFADPFPDPFPIPTPQFQFPQGSVVDPSGYVWSPVGQYNPNIGATNTYAPYAPSSMPADYAFTQAYSLAINGVGYNATDGFYSLPLANPISGDVPFILPNQLVPPTAPPTGQLN